MLFTLKSNSICFWDWKLKCTNWKWGRLYEEEFKAEIRDTYELIYHITTCKLGSDETKNATFTVLGDNLQVLVFRNEWNEICFLNSCWQHFSTECDYLALFYVLEIAPFFVFFVSSISWDRHGSFHVSRDWWTVKTPGTTIREIRVSVALSTYSISHIIRKWAPHPSDYRVI